MTQLVHPSGVFEDLVSRESFIAPADRRAAFDVVFPAGLMWVRFAAGLTAEGSTSILLYAMGRDFILAEAVFGAIQGRRQPWTEAGDGADRRFEHGGANGRCRETGRQLRGAGRE